MTRIALKAKLDSASARLTEAADALDIAMKNLSADQGGEKTLVASALAGAFERMRDAKREVAELTILLNQLDEDPS